MDSQEWLLRSVGLFRKRGFFRDYEGMSDRELAAELEETHEIELREGFDPDFELVDLELLRWDKRRVWWEDTEADVLQGNNVYVEVLQRWGMISRGAFLPSDISERWQSREGPIDISFSLRGKKESINPRYLDDYIDMEIVPHINSLIADSPYRFEIYEFFDQTAFVVVLDKDEKQWLQQERGWRFM
jgi:hypothetical protein